MLTAKQQEEAKRQIDEVRLEAALTAMNGILAGRQGQLTKEDFQRAWHISDDFVAEWRKRCNISL